MKSKNELRLYAKNLRKSSDINFVSEIACSKVEALDVFKNSKNIMIYYPLKYEINFLDLMKYCDKKFYLPKVNGDELLVCPYKSGDSLVKSDLNIFEPKTEPIDPKNLDLVIVPALMADSEGYRLGYGGGFYDRFLKKYKQNFATLSVVLEKLCVKKLPNDIFDERIDYIITV